MHQPENAGDFPFLTKDMQKRLLHLFLLSTFRRDQSKVGSDQRAQFTTGYGTLILENTKYSDQAGWILAKDLRVFCP